MKNFLTIILASFLGLSTCYAEGEPTQRSAALKMNTIVFVDHNLNRTILDSESEDSEQVIKVSVQRNGVRATPTGFLEVWVVIRNHVDYPLQVQARTSFFDAGGAPAENPTAWTRVHLPPNSIGTYKESSISDLSSNYVIELQEGR